MSLLNAELVNHQRGRTTIRVTWCIRHFWLARLLLKWPKSTIYTVVYIGGGRDWREVITYERVPKKLGMQLFNIEASLLHKYGIKGDLVWVS